MSAYDDGVSTWHSGMRNRNVMLAALVMLAGNALAQAPATVEADLDAPLTLDSHVDIPLDFGAPAYDPMQPGPRGQQVHLPTMRSGGLDAAFFVVYVGQGPRDEAGYARALSDAFRKFSAIHRMVADHADVIALARSAGEVRRIAASGRLVALIGVENGYAIGRDLRLLDQFHDYGARYFGLVHVRNNDLADAAVGVLGLTTDNSSVPEHNGLSALGRQVVARLNALGIMVDVSHASEPATMQTLELSRAPVIASHSGVQGVYAHRRNLSDAALDGIASTGGVAQIVAYDSYLRPVPEAKAQAVRALLAEFDVLSPAQLAALPPERRDLYADRIRELDARWPKAGIDDLLAHIDYAVRRIGIDHVGIASDFNGGGGIRGWENAGETHNVTRGLRARGYSDEDVEKLWSGNLLRVLEACEAFAARGTGAR